MNRVKLSGVMNSVPVYSHQIYGENFFKFELLVTRQSGCADELMCTASEVLLPEDAVPGMEITVCGEVRSHNVHEEEKNRLEIFAFAKEIEFSDEQIDINRVELDGYICKQPIYRKTPLGREICDVLIAVNRAYGKSDYIPCICWGRNARRLANMNVGTHVDVLGRLQSREYNKKLEDGSQITKVAYELSISKIEECEDEE